MTNRCWLEDGDGVGFGISAVAQSGCHHGIPDMNTTAHGNAGGLGMDVVYHLQHVGGTVSLCLRHQCDCPCD